MDSTNQTACRAWANHMNTLACAGVTYDVGEMCDSVDDSPADMARYYDCAREHSSCDGDALVADLSTCQQPMM
jgi:hypothetical protein